ncbi:hypothetical protein DIPPA_08470 [Diplonema papillatum]|nr:hypothetical protein DIPPA_08470 [Diplonema papillatum]
MTCATPPAPASRSEPRPEPPARCGTAASAVRKKKAQARRQKQVEAETIEYFLGGTCDISHRTDRPVTARTTALERDKEREVLKRVLTERVIDDESFLAAVIKASACAGGLPPVVVPKEYWVYSEAPLAHAFAGSAVEFDEQRGLWKKKIFPSEKPTSRVEVILLAKALDSMVQSIDLSVIADSDRCYAADNDDYNVTFEKLLTVYNIGFSELIRQVYMTCAERGIVLDRIRNLVMDFAHNCFDIVHYLKAQLRGCMHEIQEAKNAATKATNEAKSAQYDLLVAANDVKQLAARNDDLALRIQDQRVLEKREAMMKSFVLRQAQRNALLLELDDKQQLHHHPQQPAPPADCRRPSTAPFVPHPGPAAASGYNFPDGPLLTAASKSDDSIHAPPAVSPARKSVCPLPQSPRKESGSSEVRRPVPTVDQSVQFSGDDEYDQPLYDNLRAFCNALKQTVLRTEQATPLYSTLVFNNPLESAKWATDKMRNIVQKYLHEDEVGPDPAALLAKVAPDQAVSPHDGSFAITKKMLSETLEDVVVTLTEICTRLKSHVASAAFKEEKARVMSASKQSPTTPDPAAPAAAAPLPQLAEPGEGEVCPLCGRMPGEPLKLPVIGAREVATAEGATQTAAASPAAGRAEKAASFRSSTTASVDPGRLQAVEEEMVDLQAQLHDAEVRAADGQNEVAALQKQVEELEARLDEQREQSALNEQNLLREASRVLRGMDSGDLNFGERQETVPLDSLQCTPLEATLPLRQLLSGLSRMRALSSSQASVDGPDHPTPPHSGHHRPRPSGDGASGARQADPRVQLHAGQPQTEGVSVVTSPSGAKEQPPRSPISEADFANWEGLQASALTLDLEQFNPRPAKPKSVSTSALTRRLTRTAEERMADAAALREKRKQDRVLAKYEEMTAIASGTYQPKTKAWVLKQVAAFYKGKAVADATVAGSADVPLAEFVVDKIRQRHGSHRLSDDQIGTFLVSITAHRDDPRVSLFGRFLSGAHAPAALASSLRYSRFIDEAKVGPDYCKTQTDDGPEPARVSLMRCLFAVGQFEVLQSAIDAITEEAIACSEPVDDQTFNEAMLRTGYAPGELERVEQQWGCDKSVSRKCINKADFLSIVAEYLSRASSPACDAAPLTPKSSSDALISSLDPAPQEPSGGG